MGMELGVSHKQKKTREAVYE